jgi:hypothetical protein
VIARRICKNIARKICTGIYPMKILSALIAGTPTFTNPMAHPFNNWQALCNKTGRL